MNLGVSFNTRLFALDVHIPSTSSIHAHVVDTEDISDNRLMCFVPELSCFLYVAHSIILLEGHHPTPKYSAPRIVKFVN